MTHPLRIVPTCRLTGWLCFWVKIGQSGALTAIAATSLASILSATLTATPVNAADIQTYDTQAYSRSRPFQPVLNLPAVHPVEEPGLIVIEPAIQPTHLETQAHAPHDGVSEPVVAEPWPAAQLAIVIDDLGYDRRRGLEAIALPGRLTVAVMPHTPNARFLAEAAHEAGREIILHHPMQGSDYHQKSESPKGILTLDMGPADIRYALRQALTSVPYCSGINNHTGSTLTQARNHMYWLMQQVASTDLYYLDSRTTTQTVAGEAAQAWGVPFVSRDVFLDHDNDRASIARQFKYAVKLAKRRGHAVLIAHPRPLSLELLAQQLPLLDSEEIELVHASELIGVRGRFNPATTVAGQ